MRSYTRCSFAILNRIVENGYTTINGLTLLLLPFSFLFSLLVRTRRLLYQLKIKKVTRFSVPVIVVGNITAGGTGKTPLVIALVKLLKEKGYSPGVVSRGYGVKNLTHPRLVQKDDAVKRVGDEPLMIAQQTDCPVVICPNRVTAVTSLLSTQKIITPCDLIISDDGLQHYAMGRDIEVVVLDGTREFGNQLYLPAGPLREPLSRLKETDYLISNGKGSRRDVAFMALQPQSFISLIDNRTQLALSAFKNKTIHAVTGIGYPDRFFRTLQSLDINMTKHIFPDHYRFTPEDIDFKDNFIVIMTEKDAVKCKEFADERHFFLSVTAKLDEDFIEDILSKLKKLTI